MKSGQEVVISNGCIVSLQEEKRIALEEEKLAKMLAKEEKKRLKREAKELLLVSSGRK